MNSRPEGPGSRARRGVPKLELGNKVKTRMAVNGDGWNRFHFTRRKKDAESFLKSYRKTSSPCVKLDVLKFIRFYKFEITYTDY